MDLEKLSPRHWQVLRLIVTGATNKEIARALCIEVPTVKVHVREMIYRMGCKRRTQAAVKAVSEGLV